MPLNTRELAGPAAVWEMYELPAGAAAGIGIRNAKTGRKVAHVPAGPTDLAAARMIEQAPQMLDALEDLILATSQRVRDPAIDRKIAQARARAVLVVRQVRGD